MRTYIVECLGKEVDNKTKTRLFGQKLKASNKTEAILRFRQKLKATATGYVEYGKAFEGMFSIGHMIFTDFKAKAI